MTLQNGVQSFQGPPKTTSTERKKDVNNKNKDVVIEKNKNTSRYTPDTI